MRKGPSTHLESLYAPCLKVLLNQTVEVIFAKMLEVLHDPLILENQEARTRIMALLSL